MIRMLLFLLVASTCAGQQQGVTGTVLWVEGNQMPGINSEKRPAPKGVVREILFYEAVKMSEASGDGSLYHDVPAKLVGTATSNEEGKFTIQLPPGTYSVFTKEQDGLFANLYDGEGFINPVEVKKGEMADLTIKVNYQAAY